MYLYMCVSRERAFHLSRENVAKSKVMGAADKANKRPKPPGHPATTAHRRAPIRIQTWSECKPLNYQNASQSGRADRQNRLLEVGR